MSVKYHWSATKNGIRCTKKRFFLLFYPQKFLNPNLFEGKEIEI